MADYTLHVFRVRRSMVCEVRRGRSFKGQLVREVRQGGFSSSELLRIAFAVLYPAGGRVVLSSDAAAYYLPDVVPVSRGQVSFWLPKNAGIG